MVNILNIHKYLSSTLIKINTEKNDNVYFVEDNIEETNSHENRKFIAIQKMNIKSLKHERFELNTKGDIISIVANSETIFYGAVNSLDKSSSLSIYKINCNEMKERYVLTLDFSNKNEHLTDSYFLGLNDRYVVIAVPHPELLCERPFFNKCYLIGSVEKKTYEIPCDLDGKDTLLQLDEAWITNGSHLILKTGRIMPYEKRALLWEVSHDETLDGFFGQTESLIVCEIESFVKNIKNGHGIQSDWIIEYCEIDSTLNVITVVKDKIIYSINEFKTDSTKIKKLNLTTLEIFQTFKTNKLFDYIRYFNKDFYGLLIFEDKSFEMHNITKNQTISIIEDSIAYIDDSAMVTIEPGFKFNRIFNLKKISNGEVLESFEGRFSVFDYEKNHLLIY